MRTVEPCPIEAVSPPPAAVGRELRLAAVRRNEWTFFWLAATALAASLVLECGEDGRLRLPLVGAELPAVCWWRRCLGIDCPGCGLSRCFVSLAHGDVSAAVRYHPFGVVLFAVVAVQLPYRAMRLRRLAEGRDPWTHPLVSSLVWLLAAGVVGQWLLRIAGLL